MHDHYHYHIALLYVPIFFVLILYSVLLGGHDCRMLESQSELSEGSPGLEHTVSSV